MHGAGKRRKSMVRPQGKSGSWIGIACLALAALWLAPAPPAAAGRADLAGWLNVTWTCGQEGPEHCRPEYSLTGDSGRVLPIVLDERLRISLGALRTLAGRRVRVRGNLAPRVAA